MRKPAGTALVIILTLLGAARAADAQDFDAAEYAARRARVFERIGSGVALVLGAPEHGYPVRFRQAPDFYYLTGIEDPGAVLLLDGDTRTATVFAHVKPDWQVAMEGPGLLNDAAAAQRFGVAVQPLDSLLPVIRRAAPADTFFLPLTSPDGLQQARFEAMMMQAQAKKHPLFGGPALHETAVARIREARPGPTADINPTLDRLRWVKSPHEIALLRESGRIGAAGVAAAMRGTRPGMHEYELEAAARHVYVKSGARGDAFTPIVASGPNTLILHYTDNDRRMEAGDVVYMDYGSDYAYYTSDVTRTWPVSGTFDEGQEKMYRTILEARDAVIAAMKPGVTIGELQEIALAVYDRHGFGPQFEGMGRYLGHAVGLSVHDPWPAGDIAGFRLEPGVVWNLEPLVEDRARKIHMRLEDTIVITADGAENLTAAAPVTLAEVYALVRSE